MLGLTPEELAELHILEAAVGGSSLLEYISRVTKQWVTPWHLMPIANLFVQAEYRPVRACVSVPPRHGKTELLIHGIGWWLNRHPGHQVAYISYSAEFAHDKSRRALELARHARVPVRPGIAKAHNWKTVQGGGCLAAGIGGPLTGYGANILIIDDPIKNREEAESPTVRQKAWEWFTSTALTRVEPGGSVIVVHTRWHDDDLIGRLQRDHAANWEVVNLPAVMDDGDALWPERWSRSSLDARRREVGEYDWASLFMGQPRPKGGRLFKEPTFYEWPEIEKARILIVCDPAATGKTHADHSAIVVGAGYLGQDGLPCVDVLEVARMQVEIPQLVSHLNHLQAKWHAPVAVESVGGFKAVPQMLRQINKSLRIIELNAKGDKFTRSLPAAAAWNDGRIRVPTAAPWLQPFLNEISSFTGISDVHDDQIDALSHTYSTFSQLLPKSGRKRTNEAPWLPFG